MQMEEVSLGAVSVLNVHHQRLDLRSAADLKNAVTDLVKRERRSIVVDLEHVSFVDSTGLGAIVAALKLVGRDGELVVCGLNDSVSTLFKLTRMDKVFRCFSNRSDAVAALSAGTR